MSFFFFLPDLSTSPRKRQKKKPYLALRGGRRLDLLVARDHAQHVHQLALVLVNALDLHVEHRRQGHVDAGQLLHFGGEPRLVLELDGGPALAEGGVVGERLEARELGRVLDPLVRPQRLGDQRGLPGVAEGEPAARRDAVGLVLELLRLQRVKVLEEVVLQDLRVDRRDAVDGRGPHDGQVGHVDELDARRPRVLAEDAVPVERVLGRGPDGVDGRARLFVLRRL